MSHAGVYLCVKAYGEVNPSFALRAMCKALYILTDMNQFAH